MPPVSPCLSSRVMSARRALLGVRLQALAHASGLTKQRLSQIMNAEEELGLRVLRRMAVLLYCPAELLIAHDASEALRYPLPPSTWLQTIESHRGQLGFAGSEMPDWPAVEALISREHDRLMAMAAAQAASEAQS